MPLLCDLVVVEPDEGVEEGSCECSHHEDHDAHLLHALGHVPADIIQVSPIEAVLSSQVFGVDALVVKHAEEDMAEASAYDDDSIDEHLQLGVVLVAGVHDCVEGQTGEEGVKGEGLQDEH